MITLLQGAPRLPDEKLTLHFLSYGMKQVSVGEQFKALLGECASLTYEAQALSAAYELYDYTPQGDALDLGFCKVHSRDLARSLTGCKKIILFAATAGIGIDRLIVKYEKLAPSKAAVLQAQGAALVEKWCDELCEGFTRDYGANKFRFSCGFGDLKLELQRDIFRALKLEKNLGLSLSQACIMTPSKSVTAIVGIKQ